MIQEVFNNVNEQYSCIVAGNQRRYAEGQLDNAKISMYGVFHVIFEKPPEKNTSTGKNTKDDNT